MQEFVSIWLRNQMVIFKVIAYKKWSLWESWLYLQFITKFSVCGKKHYIPSSINLVNILFFNLQYMYHKGDYSSEILLYFFPKDQYTRSYKYRMKAMDKMTELGWWEIKILKYMFLEPYAIIEAQHRLFSWIFQLCAIFVVVLLSMKMWSNKIIMEKLPEGVKPWHTIFFKLTFQSKPLFWWAHLYYSNFYYITIITLALSYRKYKFQLHKC